MLKSSYSLGIKSSLGELIAFLEDDDEWFPEKLYKAINKDPFHLRLYLQYFLSFFPNLYKNLLMFKRKFS